MGRGRSATRQPTSPTCSRSRARKIRRVRSWPRTSFRPAARTRSSPMRSVTRSSFAARKWRVSATRPNSRRATRRYGFPAGSACSSMVAAGQKPIQRGTCTLPDGQTLRFVVNDEKGASTPDGTFRIYAGLRSDPFILAWLEEALAFRRCDACLIEAVATVSLRQRPSRATGWRSDRPPQAHERLRVMRRIPLASQHSPVPCATSSPQPGWSQEDREWYYQFSQGSTVISYDIFLNLEVAGSQELFRSDANQRALRPDPASRESAIQSGWLADWPRQDHRFRRPMKGWRGRRLCRPDLRGLPRRAAELQGQAHSH